MKSRSLQLKSPSKNIVQKFKIDHVFNEIMMVVCAALSLFTFISLISFHAQDPSSFFYTQNPPLNLCGYFGAWVAALLLNWFGIGSFLIPISFLFLSMTLWNAEGFHRLLSIVASMSVCVMSLTVFLTIVWPQWNYGGASLIMGGALGFWVSTQMVEYLNSVGAQLVSLSIFLCALTISVPFSFIRLLVFISQKLFIISAYLLSVGALKFTVFIYQASKKLLISLEPIKNINLFQKQKTEDSKKILEVQSEVVEPHAEMRSPPTEEINTPFEEINVSDSLDDFSKTGESIDMIALKKNREDPKILPPTMDSPFMETPIQTKDVIKKSLRKSLLSKTGPWKHPSLEFLRKAPKVESSINKEKLLENSKILEQKFLDFGIDGQVTAVRPGPVITLYEFKPGPGVKVSRIAALSDDLSMALSAESVRILAPLPGKAVVGIEIPSDHREKVFFREFLQNENYYSEHRNIPVVMGKDIGGATVYSDLSKMPHLLCAGQTGSGKSVFMNGLICSLLYRFTPDQMRLILVDPKFIEFRSYQDIPHLLLPVVDDSKHASNALKWAVREMERRYRILAKMGVRNLESYNQKVDEMGVEVVSDLLFEEEEGSDAQRNISYSGSDWSESFEKNENGEAQIGKLPYIVIIIDELADLMMIAKKEVEISIARISQKARAAGIHLVIATQRPSTDVITGLIKANLPSRVSFQLASYIDSKTILDRAGAERLLGQGDMLFIPPGTSQLLRLHGAYVDDEEINKITQFLRSQGEPVYRQEIIVDEEEENAQEFSDEDLDVLFNQAVELIRKSGHASASYLQRHLSIGYNRAAKLIEVMEEKGIVGPSSGNAKSREVLLR